MIRVLFSGGVDSLVHLRWAMAQFPEVEAIYYDVGQIYAAREIPQAAKMASVLGIRLHIDYTSIKLYEDLSTGKIELRNLALISLASREVEGVVFGMLQGETPVDKNPTFVRRLEKLLQSQRPREPFKIYTPFSRYTKSEMIRWYMKQFGQELLLDSVACFFSSDSPMCGHCMSCFNRWIAFKECGLPDEIYALHPAFVMLRRLRRMKKDHEMREWEFVNLPRIWSRRRWVLECWRQLNIFSRQHFNMTAWRYIHS